MGLFRRKKTSPRESDSLVPRSPAASRRKATLTPMEVKLLALEALQTGLTKAEVAEIIGVAGVTVSNWQKKYDEEGLPGLYHHPSSKQALARCQSLERRIVQRRQSHPERGVRRIRDDLRREEGRRSARNRRKRRSNCWNRESRSSRNQSKRAVNTAACRLNQY